MYKGNTQADLDIRMLDYESHGNYNAYLVSCQILSKVKLENKMIDGYKKIVTSLTPNMMQNLRNLMDSETSAKLLLDTTIRAQVLEMILTCENDQIIKSYFQADYVPLWMKFLKNDPGLPLEDRPYHVNWHCDGGPNRHLKMLVDLNDNEEHGGYTEMMSLGDTERFKRHGYVWCPLDDRLPSLKPLGISYQRFHKHLQPAEGLLFEPANIMHKAKWPDKAPRYIIQLCFLPADKDWRSLLKENPQLPSESTDWPIFEMRG